MFIASWIVLNAVFLAFLILALANSSPQGQTRQVVFTVVLWVGIAANIVFLLVSWLIRSVLHRAGPSASTKTGQFVQDK